MPLFEYSNIFGGQKSFISHFLVKRSISQNLTIGRKFKVPDSNISGHVKLWRRWTKNVTAYAKLDIYYIYYKGLHQIELSLVSTNIF